MCSDYRCIPRCDLRRCVRSDELPAYDVYRNSSGDITRVRTVFLVVSLFPFKPQITGFGCFEVVLLLKKGHNGERSMIRIKDHLLNYPYL